MRIHPIAAMPLKIQGLSTAGIDGITGFPEPLALQNHELHWNLRAFGYFDRKVSLSMRTVHEAMQSADAINKKLALSNPGPSCAQAYDEALACFVRSSTQEGPQRSTEECLALCRTQEPPKTSGSFLNDFLSNGP